MSLISVVCVCVCEITRNIYVATRKVFHPVGLYSSYLRQFVYHNLVVNRMHVIIMYLIIKRGFTIN
jgi:hypothetical protein